MTYGDDSRTTSGGTWNLIFDVGNSQGWNSLNGSNQCLPTPLANSYTQQSVGVDFNSTGQVKNPDGTLWLSGTLSGLFLHSTAGFCGATSGPYPALLYPADLTVCQYAL